MRRAAALTALLLILCSCVASAPAQRDPAEVTASASYKATADGYDRLQERMKSLRLAGLVSKDQWAAEWTPIQFEVSRTAADVAADLVTWRTTGSRPALYDAHNSALDTAVAKAEAYVRRFQ